MPLGFRFSWQGAGAGKPTVGFPSFHVQGRARLVSASRAGIKWGHGVPTPLREALEPEFDAALSHPTPRTLHVSS